MEARYLITVLIAIAAVAGLAGGFAIAGWLSIPELRAEISTSRAEIRSDIATSRAELRNEIETMHARQNILAAQMKAYEIVEGAK